MKSNMFLLLITTAFLLWMGNGNLWDNIYSQTLADTPIILSESLSFDTDLQSGLKARVDFNAELQTITVAIYIDLIVKKVDMVVSQLDLATLVLTIQRGSNKCERYNIAAFKSASLPQRKISKQRLFLVNILFKFIGKSKNKNIYKFEPFIIAPPNNTSLKQAEDRFKEQLPKDQKRDDFKPDIQLYLHVNSATGSLEAIYSGQKQETKVPFKTVSTVQEKMKCAAEIHSISTKDIQSIFKFIEQERKKVK